MKFQFHVKIEAFPVSLKPGKCITESSEKLLAPV